MNEMRDNTHPPAIIPGILANKKLVPEEKDINRLADEATFLMIAGTDAPSQVLAITMYHILRNPTIQERLLVELAGGWPDLSVKPTWTQLQEFEYLVSSWSSKPSLSAINSTLPTLATDCSCKRRIENRRRRYHASPSYCA